MARNKKKNVKDKEGLKRIRKEAKKRWKARKKLKKTCKEMELQQETRARGSIEMEIKESLNEVQEDMDVDQSVSCAQALDPKLNKSNYDQGELDDDRRQDEVGRVDAVPHTEGTANPERGVDEEHELDIAPNETSSSLIDVTPKLHGSVKEISACEVIKSKTCLGAGSFGSCYLAKYRGITVAVKEYHLHRNVSEKMLKREVIHEATVLSGLGDHPGLPLLFGVSTLQQPYRLITQFHGEEKSVTLMKALKKVSLSNKEWTNIMKNISLALSRVHEMKFLHNDIKANNVVLERRGNSYNPVLVDFGKARKIENPKPRKVLSLSEQRAYMKKYPHIAPELPKGQGTQSISSDVFSLGFMFINVKEIMKPSSSRQGHTLTYKLKMAVHDIPSLRPSMKSIVKVLTLLEADSV